MTRHLSLCALLLVLGLAVGVLASDVSYPSATHQVPLAQPIAMTPATHSSRPTLDENIYLETWESNTLDGWTPVDFLHSASWHRASRDAFGGTGTSWWVGDPSIGVDSGGYDNNWYMVLDSPPITLPAGTPTLKFFHRYKAETASAYQGYDAWDGMNLRISTNSGSTWTIVPTTALAPHYDKARLFSFGKIHCEGTTVPGWCTLEDSLTYLWHQQTANLSAWAGQTIKLRWAFASDGAYSTRPDASDGSDSSMFGWMVDNIRVYSGTDTVFSNNGDDSTGWTSGLATASTGGAPWHVIVDDADNATHVVTCTDANGQFHPNMSTALMSPYIDMRGRPFGQVFPDVSIWGDMDTVNGGEDHWRVEVTRDSGLSWCSLEYPDCSSQGFVFIGSVPTWERFSEAGFTANWADLYPYTSNVLRFRLVFNAGCDNVTGMGMRFDSFRVDYSQGYQFDVTTKTLQVRYPNIAGRPFHMKAYFENLGQDAVSNILGYWRYIPPTTTTWRLFRNAFDLASGAIVVRDSAITLNAADTYTLRARCFGGSDQYTANDTATVTGVIVQPAGSPLEIGYDNHDLTDPYFQFNGFATGNGALVHFTPAADHVLQTNNYSIHTIKAQFSSTQTSDAQMRMHIYLGGATAPSTTEIYNQLVTVTPDETGPGTWKEFDVHGTAATQNISQDFWVWFEITQTGAAPHYPAVLAITALPWDDIHHYSWTGGTNTPVEVQNFYHIHAVLDEVVSAREISSSIPNDWSLTQNFPNPFNPTTEIRYAVPRAEHLTLKVYNLMGQEVATLVDAMTNPGTYAVNFSGANLASGVYVYRLEAPSFTATHKMLLMK
jgi:hypothetical protein